MDSINIDVMKQNRDKLISWQTQHYSNVSSGEVRLHVGCGKVKRPGYLNCDLYPLDSEVMKVDFTDLSQFEDNSIDEISAHHVLEHIPYWKLEDCLKEWYRALKPGGRIDIGSPDIALCMQDFLGCSEEERWIDHGGIPSRLARIYGLPEEGMQHRGCVTKDYFERLIKSIGFKVLDSFHYDANGVAFSFWVYAEKKKSRTKLSLLEKDTVLGVFTHTDKYIPPLRDSIKKFFPNILYIEQVAPHPINEGMKLLLEKFKETGKRYMICLDHDIQFLHEDTINDSLEAMVRNNWGGVSIYSSFDPKVLVEDYDPSKYKLTERLLSWMTGYYMAWDSLKVPNYIDLVDMNLPDACTSIDTSFTVGIKSQGWKIGIVPHYVYHQAKKNFWEGKDQKEIIRVTNEYLTNKWGQYYFDICKYNGVVIEWGLEDTGAR